jgi:hypothetical protein
LPSVLQPIGFVLKRLETDAILLLSALARVGHENSDAVQSAFRLGLAKLAIEDPTASLLPINECSLDRIDAALDRLSQATLPLKKRVLDACAHTASADGLIQENEAQLLRAIADTLDCPVPPG